MFVKVTLAPLIDWVVKLD